MSGILLLAIVGGIVTLVKVYGMGAADGKRQREKELEGEIKRHNAEINRKLKELANQESDLSTAHQELDLQQEETRRLLTNAKNAKAKSSELLSHAREESRNAYENGVKKREAELQLIIQSILSQQPNNSYITHILADTEEILVNRAIDHYIGESAPVTAKALQKQISASHKRDRTNAMLYKFQCELYEQLFPELKQYKPDKEEINSDIIKSDESDWLSDDEYATLSPAERSQLALDRYIKSTNKSKWQIGRDFELFIGHEYRKDGWKVEQFGIKNGLEDLGRDLICKKGNVTHVVQCKFWSQGKLIREKHIAQLYGTTIAYQYEHELIKTGADSEFFKNLHRVQFTPVFITSTELSKQAKRFALSLGVTVIDNKQLGDFPRIKCNVSKSGEKIFHLPFDQQYDSTDVVFSDGDCFAFTVAEAIENGFRRAKKHVYKE